MMIVVYTKQMNGLVVNTTPGDNVLVLCRQDHLPQLLDMILAQANGTVVHDISLRAPLSVRLVPHCRHELLFSAQEDTFHFAVVFGNRLNDLVGEEHKKLKVLKDGDQQMIVLRAVVMKAQQSPLGWFQATACFSSEGVPCEDRCGLRARAEDGSSVC